MKNDPAVDTLARRAAMHVQQGVSQWDKGNQSAGDQHIKAANFYNDRIDTLRGNADKGQ